MNRSQRLATLSLMGALAAPALLLAARSAHPFEIGPALLLPVLAWLAAGLAWRQDGARLPWRWALPLGLLALAWPLLWLATHPRGVSLLRRDFSPAWPWLQRGSLWLLALPLAWEAWRAWRTRLAAPAASQTPPPLDPWVRRFGLSLLALWFISGALSFRPDLSLRALLSWGSYPLLFAAAYRLGDTPRRRRALLLLLLSVGAVNAVYGVQQALDLDPMHWSRGFGGRAVGFLGNPNFLGGQLALLLPLGLALALDGRGSARAQAWRWLLAGLLALGLLLSQTRGAWAGAAVGCGLLLWQLRRRAPELLRRQRTPLLAGLLLFTVFGGLYVVTQPTARQRLGALLSGQDAEAGRRAFLMRKSAQVALEHPWLGVGPGNFRLWFPSVQVRGIAPADYAAQPYVQSEHSHNDLLQMAADCGWAAALLWLLLLAAVARALWRGLAEPGRLARRQPEALLLLGALAALLALNLHGLANFPFLILATQSSAWVLAALALRAAAQPPAAADELAEEAGAGEAAAPPASAGLGRGWSLALGLLILLELFAVGARGLLKDELWWVGEGELNLHHEKDASSILLEALAYDRQEDRLWKLHGRAELERELVWNSIGSLREAVRLNPFDAEAAVRLGRALVENRQLDEAVKVLSPVAQYAPNFVDVWEPLAAALYQTNKFEEAVKAYDWMIYFQVNEEAAYANKAAALGSLGQLPQALLVLKAAEMKLPQSGKIQVNIAITYLKLGMRPQAREAWKKAYALSPSDPQVDQMKKVLR